MVKCWDRSRRISLDSVTSLDEVTRLERAVTTLQLGLGISRKGDTALDAVKTKPIETDSDIG